MQAEEEIKEGKTKKKACKNLHRKRKTKFHVEQ
jgi:hypothetical protein